MENIADALKMAAEVLIFVLALSISISAFGQARQTSQILLEYNDDRIYEYTWIEANSKDTNRIVGAETIVPAIYRAYKENYKINFEFKDNNSCLYTKLDENTGDMNVLVRTIDLEKEIIGTNAQKEEFITYLLYGTKITDETPLEKSLGIDLPQSGLYGIIVDGKLKFEEKLGIYYQEEVDGRYDTPKSNRTKKRIITYTEQ